MSRDLRRPTVLALALAGTLALSLAPTATAQAAEQWFSLQGVTDSGPLAASDFSGSFAYDTAAAGPDFSGSVVLTAFSLTFVGQRYTLASADAAPVAWFEGGVFLGLDYADADSADTALRPNLALVPGFSGLAGEAFLAYTGPGGLDGAGSYSTTAVPEPASLALLLAGLGVVAAGVRRRG